MDDLLMNHETDDLTFRLTKLERKHRRLVIICASSAFSLIVFQALQLGVSTFSLSEVHASTSSVSNNEPTKIVRASKFIVEDDKGKVCGFWGVGEDDELGLSIVGRNGSGSIWLGMENQDPSFEMKDRNGSRRIWAWTNRADAGLSIEDGKDENRGIDLANLGAGISAMTIKGRENRRIFLQVHSDKPPRLEVFDKGGKLLFKPN